MEKLCFKDNGLGEESVITGWQIDYNVGATANVMLHLYSLIFSNNKENEINNLLHLYQVEIL